MPITKKFSDDLKTTGTNHLVVASGYNIGILLSMLIKTSNYLSKNKVMILVIIMVACYTLISGLDPSIIRASIMASLGLIAMNFGRQRQAIYLLLMAGTIMLVLNPLWIYDVGFQLSFAATFGIIALQATLNKKLAWAPTYFREAISVTMAAQIFVYPILATTFGQISIISLLTNLLVTWVIPFVMLGGIIIVVSSFIVQPLAQACAIFIYPSIWFIRNIVAITSNIPYATVTISNINWLSAFVYYAIIYYLYQMKVIHEVDSPT
jgi:competence protein ComEC